MKRERVVLGSVSLALCSFLALQPGAASGSCPPPETAVCPASATFSVATDRCEASFAACLSGYAYNATSNRCEVTAIATTSSASCPAGSAFNPYYGKCETANLSPCPAGYTFNVDTNKCEISATAVPADSCPAGYTYNSANNRCDGGSNSACEVYGGYWGVYEQACTSTGPLPFFNWDDETGFYIGPWVCPPFYSPNGTDGSCHGPRVTASCPAGSTVNPYTNKCESTAGAACAAGKTYNRYTTKCDFAPVVSADPSACPAGYTLDVDTNRCLGAMHSACPYGGSYGYYEQACTLGGQAPGYNWDDETGFWIGPVVCPPGFSLDPGSSSCSGPACPAGQAYDTATSTCEVPPPATASTLICPAATSFSPYYGKCEAANLSPCPSGYTYNVYTARCEIPATFTPASSCSDGYAFDSASNKCIGGPNSACSLGGTWGNYEETCVSATPLPGFNWDDETGFYIGPWICPPAYSVAGGVCSGPMVTASCPAGSTINSYTSKCEAPAGAACAAGQTYNPTTTKCDFAPPVSVVAPTCPPNYILNVDANVCFGAMHSACPYGGSYGYYEQACTLSSPAPGYNWDEETGFWIGPVVCPPGFSLDSGSSSCHGPACPSGYAFNASTSTCQPSGCPAGTVKSGSLCTAAPVCQ